LRYASPSSSDTLSGAAKPPVRVLFICVGNSCRSQMAEALARHFAADVVEAASAGIRPLGTIAALTHEVLNERGVALDGQFSKGIHDVAHFETDIIVNMSGIPSSALFRDQFCEDWPVDDPYGDDLATYRRICDDIAARVMHLAQRIRKSRAPHAKKAPRRKPHAR
jgi:arsenate reductase (thioredoxin)